MLKPSCRVFRRFVGLIHDGDWTPHDGWEHAGPFPFWREINYQVGRDRVPKDIAARHAANTQPLLSTWAFYGSSTDQGLLHYVFTSKRKETCAAERGRWRGSSCVVIHPRTAFNEILHHFLSHNKPWLIAPEKIERTVVRRHVSGAKTWQELFDELELPHPEGKAGDPPLEADELPFLLAPLHTGLGSSREVELRMSASDRAGTTVFVHTAETRK